MSIGTRRAYASYAEPKLARRSRSSVAARRYSAGNVTTSVPAMRSRLPVARQAPMKWIAIPR